LSHEKSPDIDLTAELQFLALRAPDAAPQKESGIVLALPTYQSQERIWSLTQISVT
jgi:hypothetical protein